MSKKILSVCLAFVFLCTLAVPVFAAESTETTGVVSNWYNTQQPYDETCYYYDGIGTNDFAYYYDTGLNFTNTANSTVSVMAFGFSDDGGTGGWEMSCNPAFDYYVNLIVYADTTAVSDFTFYPTDFYIEYTAHDGTPIRRDLEAVSISHYDTKHTLGYSVVGRIPVDSYFGCPIRSLMCSGSGSVPAGLKVSILMYQVPKSSDGVTIDVSAIVNAITQQTTDILSKMSKYTSKIVNTLEGDSDSSAEQINSELSQVIGQVDGVEQDIHEQAEEAFLASDSIISSFNPSAFKRAGNIYKTYSQVAFDAMGQISFFIIIPLILFCAGAFIGKLR